MGIVCNEGVEFGDAGWKEIAAARRGEWRSVIFGNRSNRVGRNYKSVVHGLVKSCSSMLNYIVI